MEKQDEAKERKIEFFDEATSTYDWYDEGEMIPIKLHPHPDGVPDEGIEALARFLQDFAHVVTTKGDAEGTD